MKFWDTTEKQNVLNDQVYSDKKFSINLLDKKSSNERKNMDIKIAESTSKKQNNNLFSKNDAITLSDYLYVAFRLTQFDGTTDQTRIETEFMKTEYTKVSLKTMTENAGLSLEGEYKEPDTEAKVYKLKSNIDHTYEMNSATIYKIGSQNPSSYGISVSDLSYSKITGAYTKILSIIIGSSPKATSFFIKFKSDEEPFSSVTSKKKSTDTKELFFFIVSMKNSAFSVSDFSKEGGFWMLCFDKSKLLYIIKFEHNLSFHSESTKNKEKQNKKETVPNKDIPKDEDDNNDRTEKVIENTNDNNIEQSTSSGKLYTNMEPNDVKNEKDMIFNLLWNLITSEKENINIYGEGQIQKEVTETVNEITSSLTSHINTTKQLIDVTIRELLSLNITEKFFFVENSNDKTSQEREIKYKDSICAIISSKVTKRLLKEYNLISMDKNQGWRALLDNTSDIKDILNALTDSSTHCTFVALFLIQCMILLMKSMKEVNTNNEHTSPAIPSSDFLLRQYNAQLNTKLILNLIEKEAVKNKDNVKIYTNAHYIDEVMEGASFIIDKDISDMEMFFYNLIPIISCITSMYTLTNQENTNGISMYYLPYLWAKLFTEKFIIETTRHIQAEYYESVINNKENPFDGKFNEYKKKRLFLKCFDLNTMLFVFLDSLVRFKQCGYVPNEANFLENRQKRAAKINSYLMNHWNELNYEQISKSEQNEQSELPDNLNNGENYTNIYTFVKYVKETFL